MKCGVIVFPGSNCDRDVATVLAASGAAPQMVWHGESTLPALDLVVLPGGFSYGDYLRCGAMAAHSPIMREVIKFAESGGHVLGICNGFQVLTEAGLLPGTLMVNQGLKFICRPVHLRVETTDSVFTSGYQKGQIVNFPIAHKEGNYFADEATLKQLEDGGQIMFRYVSEAGEASLESNPNGSARNIAGIRSARGNVMGLMPHPERHADPLTGGNQGRILFETLKKAFH